MLKLARYILYYKRLKDAIIIYRTSGGSFCKPANGINLSLLELISKSYVQYYTKSIYIYTTFIYINVMQF